MKKFTLSLALTLPLLYTFFNRRDVEVVTPPPELLAAPSGLSPLQIAPPLSTGGKALPSFPDTLGEVVDLGVYDVDCWSRGMECSYKLPKWRRFVATAYSHGCTNPRSGKEPSSPASTASRESAVPNWTVAADSEFPFHTVLEISYKGVPERYIVHDRGPDIVGNRIDVFLATCEEARRFGRRVVYVREVRRPLGRM